MQTQQYLLQNNSTSIAAMQQPPNLVSHFSNLKNLNIMVAEVYDKIKEMVSRTGERSVPVNSVAMELRENPSIIREYITALDILGYLQFDSSTGIAVMA